MKLVLAQLGVLVGLVWSQIELEIYRPDWVASVIEVPVSIRSYLPIIMS